MADPHKQGPPSPMPLYARVPNLNLSTTNSSSALPLRAQIRRPTKKEGKKPRYGNIPGYEVGHVWENRRALYESGFHLPLQAGIHGRQSTGAYSIVISGGYEDDIDEGYEFLYTGHGGQKPRNEKDRQQAEDQHWTLGNKALQMSHKLNKPVRVIRGSRLQSKWAPVEGYRYDGLYNVIECSEAEGKSGHKICVFRFRRCSGQKPLQERRENEPLVPTPSPRILGPAPDPTTHPRSHARSSSTGRRNNELRFEQGSSSGTSRSRAPAAQSNSIYANYPQLRRNSHRESQGSEFKLENRPNSRSPSVAETLQDRQKVKAALQRAMTTPIESTFDGAHPAVSSRPLNAVVFNHINTSVSDVFAIPDYHPTRSPNPTIASPVSYSPVVDPSTFNVKQEEQSENEFDDEDDQPQSDSPSECDSIEAPEDEPRAQIKAERQGTAEEIEYYYSTSTE